MVENCCKMKAIGGYFEIEEKGIGVFPHKNGILLNTGRNSLEYILRTIPYIEGLILPYYTCEVVLEPINKLNIPYKFYHINKNLEIDEDLSLPEGWYIIANNYFGIKDSYIKFLAEKYKGQLIIDCAQAFFSPQNIGMKMFYSTRKYVGVPDGGVAYGISDASSDNLGIDDSSERLNHLYIRKEKGAEAGFRIYQENESKLDNQDIRRMSSLTKDILDSIDYEYIKKKRRTNFQYIHNYLKNLNHLSLPSIDSFVCPMVYPFYSSDPTLKKKLINNKIFVATYWPNVFEWCKEDSIEYQLANKIVPIPIDQRYGEKEMNYILKTILK